MTCLGAIRCILNGRCKSGCNRAKTCDSVLLKASFVPLIGDLVQVLPTVLMTRQAELYHSTVLVLLEKGISITPVRDWAKDKTYEAKRTTPTSLKLVFSGE